jgi:DNA-binding SARP family transcriptional activator/tetratricopeptide (TPR) repeat protein
MRFVILGATALSVGGEQISLGTAKQRALLALLLYHVGEPVTVDTIVEHLWDRGDPREYRGSLYSMVSRARAVLNRVERPHALVRLSGINAYRLEIDPDLIDFHRFRRLVREARTATGDRADATAVPLLDEAVALWRDEPLADLRGARSDHLRRQMRDDLLDAQKALIAAELRIGRHFPAMARLEPLLRAHDLDDVLARHWIAGLTAAGHEDDARAYLATFRRRFRQEMHAEPAVDLQVRPTEPAARAHVPAGGPRQLPADIADYTGHEDLLAELDALTAGEEGVANVVAISGMPGVGKTSLAIHFGHRHRRHFIDGQLYVDLNGHGAAPPVDPAEALGRFLRALDVPGDRIPVGTEQRRDRLNQLLSGRKMLILLDNVFSSEQAELLLTTSDSCVTLITSRNRLTGLVVRHGVRAVTVPPLSDGASIALLGRMVGPARAGMEPLAVHALARHSGGLPLALRIIGEQVASRPEVPIRDLVDELAGHLLDNDSDEEASLAGAFAWSYDALRPDVARLFRILGLHPGRSISVEAAAALLSMPVSRVQRLLDAMARTHLVGHERLRRYRFHDLVRRFAADRAEEEETTADRVTALRRLLDWALLSAANAAIRLEPNAPPVPDLPAAVDVIPLKFDSAASAMAWCEAERENLAALTSWAAGHGYDRYAWQLPGVVYEVLDRYGSQGDMVEMLTIAKAAAERDGHPIGRIGTTINLATARCARHDYRCALESFGEALRLARAIDDPDAAACALHNLGVVHLRLGEVAAAEGVLGQVLDIARARGDHATEAAARRRLGDVHLAMRRFDDAIADYLAALDLHARLESLRGQAVTRAALAKLYLATAQHETALKHCQLALDLHERTRDEVSRCDILVTAADVELHLRRHDDAERSARAALAIGEEIDDPLLRARALAVLADILVVTGRMPAAATARAEAVQIANELDDPEVAALRRRLLA